MSQRRYNTLFSFHTLHRPANLFFMLIARLTPFLGSPSTPHNIIPYETSNTWMIHWHAMSSEMIALGHLCGGELESCAIKSAGLADAISSSNRFCRTRGRTLVGSEKVQLPRKPPDGCRRGDAERRRDQRQQAALPDRQGPRLQRELPSRDRQIVRETWCPDDGGGEQHGDMWVIHAEFFKIVFIHSRDPECMLLYNVQ